MSSDFARGTITHIQKVGSSEDYVVFVDGEPAFEADMEMILSLGLKVGVRLDEDAMSGARDKAEERQARTYALRLLTIRPRTQSEIRLRLGDRSFSSPCIDRTIDWLRSLGYLDDRAFARNWIESRARGKPAGRRLIAYELQQKGVDRNLVSEILEEIDSEDELKSARLAATSRLRRMGDADKVTVRRRLEAHLYRRGFGTQTIVKVVSELLASSED